MPQLRMLLGGALVGLIADGCDFAEVACQVARHIAHETPQPRELLLGAALLLSKSAAQAGQ